MTRTCDHCYAPIPATKRQGARFCKPACRVNHHVKTRPAPTLTDDVHLSPVEAGLLIDSAAPFAPRGAGRRPAFRHPLYGSLMHGKEPTQEAIDAWRAHCQAEARAKRVQRAWLRLAALSLVRVGKLGQRTVIERTAAGSALLHRRHNELHAGAERECGRLVSEMPYRPLVVYWRGGDHTVVGSGQP